jgi:hypothetical protein
MVLHFKATVMLLGSHVIKTPEAISLGNEKLSDISKAKSLFLSK